ncbi:GAF domain-containing protein [Amycolatopsis sp. cg13]|uniref:GAF domain-containing protein n=1 Tax=Amycolatopsis sp. cg13 TaxID=3238807 RepID=UPI003524C5B8
MNKLSEEWVPILLEAARTLTGQRAGLDAAYLLTGVCTRLPGVDEAIVLLPDDRGRGVPLAGTDWPLFDDLLAFRADEDLCGTAGEGEREAAVYADLAGQAGRWPGLARIAAAHGIAAVHTVPMEAFGELVGTVVLTSRERQALSAGEIAFVRGCAGIAAAGLLADAVAETLPSAVLRLSHHTAQQDQIAVWQAAGMLAGHSGVDLAAAEAMLRAHARDLAQPLVHSAERVADGGADEIAGPGHDTRILVVDPDRFTVSCLSDTLRAAGFDVTAVVSAAAAQSAVPPPVAIIDQTAAGAGDLIRTLSEGPGTQVIVISPVAVRQAPPATARVLPKPVHPSQVLAVVRDLHPAARQAA